ncbi:MAG: hypothetical protein M0Z75_17355 [Nitrospiraceae bacterium]|nr:hypothetical protein [Nitrospiraceae bacterium]
MKRRMTVKRIFSIFALALALAVAQGERAWGAGSVLCGANDKGLGYVEIICSATGDAATGSFPAVSLAGIWPDNRLNNGGFYIYQMETAPGSPAPTNGYGVTLTDAYGYDYLGGQGANQSATAATLLKGINAFADSAPTLAITGNSVAAAVVNIKMVLVR